MQPVSIDSVVDLPIALVHPRTRLDFAFPKPYRVEQVQVTAAAINKIIVASFNCFAPHIHSNLAAMAIRDLIRNGMEHSDNREHDMHVTYYVGKDGFAVSYRDGGTYFSRADVKIRYESRADVNISVASTPSLFGTSLAGAGCGTGIIQSIFDKIIVDTSTRTFYGSRTNE